MAQKDKYIPCSHCTTPVEKHHLKQHEKKCFFRSHNLVKIADFFTECLINIGQLKRKTFHHYCVQDAKVLSPVSMSKYLHQNKFKHLVVQLLVILHKADLFDWEYSEILIYHLTSGHFYMDSTLLEYLYRQSADVRGLRQIDTESNYNTLYNRMLVRAMQDLRFSVGQKNENNEEVELDIIISAIEFLLNNEPGMITQAKNSGKFSQDAENALKIMLGTVC